MTDALPKNPYVGPHSFQAGKRLYGRDLETEALINRLITERVVLLHSPSGAGKTSLIQAAVLPALRRMRFLVAGPARVGLTPRSESARRARGYNRYRYSTLLTLQSGLEEAEGMKIPELEEGDEVALARASLRGAVDAIFASMTERMSLLLVFDQFEEVLTIDPLDAEAKKKFFRELGGVLKDERVWALFAAREDYLGAFAGYLDLVPTRLNERARLDLLGVEAARDAIVRPAAEEKVKFEKAAADELIDSLREMRVQNETGETTTVHGPYIEPVLLQVVCHSLWEIPRPNPLRIGREQVAAMGGVENALIDYYDGVIARILVEAGPLNITVTERQVRYWIEQQLITPGGLRSQVMLEAGSTRGLDNRVIEMLIDLRLVRRENRLGSVWFELAHDRLIQPVKTSNGRQMVSPFQRRALQWETQGRAASLLMTNRAELDEAEDWVEANVDGLTDFEKQFLAFSQVAARQIEREVSETAARRTNLEDLGWGVIFADGADPRIREALKPLLDHRRKQAAARRPEFYHEFTGEDGCQSGETAREFLRRHQVGMLQAEPDKMPYYLLIVGDPETIPFEFQYGLDLQYAVGRIHFERLEDYERYARSVVLCESGEFSLPHRAVVFSPTHPGDKATAIGLRFLAKPVTEKIQGQLPDWEVTPVFGEEAGKARLGALMGGGETPAVLFTVSQPVTFPKDHPLLLDDNGALVCADWPGPGGKTKRVTREFYFSAADVSDEARLLGSVFFLFGGSTAGHPRLDEFPDFTFTNKKDSKVERKELAARPFLAALPRRLLGHPLGGALGVIGHVDRNWTLSFLISRPGEKEIPDTAVFEDALRRILSGHTLGSAMEPFTQRLANSSSELAEKLRQEYFFGEKVDRKEMAVLEREGVDARNYILLGDPAARLPVAGGMQVDARPTIPFVAAWPVEAAPVPSGAEPPEGADASREASGVWVEGVGTYLDRLQQAAAGEDLSLAGGQKGVEPESNAPSPNLHGYAEKMARKTMSRGMKAEGVIPVVINGIDPSSGEYLLPDMTLQQLMAICMSQDPDVNDADLLREMRWLLELGKSY